MLRKNGIVLHRNRVIFEAAPPIAAEDLQWVEDRCAGPIPDELMAIWSVTAGGRIAYDVTVQMSGGEQSFSWVELFFRGAETYRDLFGWIEAELELLEDACRESDIAFPGKLQWLPIGGFEYLDRVYIRVQPGEDFGTVSLWMRGLPPAWVGRLHEDTTGFFAPNLDDAFARMGLDADPLVAAKSYRLSDPMLEYVARRVDEHGLDPALATRLLDHYATAFVE